MGKVLEETGFGEMNYYANSMNDIGSAMVTLFELLVVNNWCSSPAVLYFDNTESAASSGTLQFTLSEVFPSPGSFAHLHINAHICTSTPVMTKYCNTITAHHMIILLLLLCNAVLIRRVTTMLHCVDEANQRVHADCILYVMPPGTMCCGGL